MTHLPVMRETPPGRRSAALDLAAQVLRTEAAAVESLVDYEMSRKGLGMTCVTDAHGRLAGLVTDGDLRRLMMRDEDITRRTAGEIMTRGPVTITGDALAAAALQVMEARRITSVPVVGDDGRPLGVLHIHDLWRTELF